MPEGMPRAAAPARLPIVAADCFKRPLNGLGPGDSWRAVGFACDESIHLLPIASARSEESIFGECLEWG